MNPKSPSRRQVLYVSLAGLSATGCGGGSTSDRGLRFGSLAQASAELTALASAKQRVAATGWNWAQTLHHCAQSIEYSMSGFPESKSRIFQATAGSVAFALFEFRGRMTHDLMEPIPGAPALDEKLDESQALDRMRAAISAFARWQKDLHPHFAYGPLSKSQYELAHAMHLANHLSYFRAG